MNTTPCKSCGAAIWWVRMPSGAIMPLQAEPSASGNIRITGEREGETLAETLTALEAANYEGDKYTSHYADCPDAQRFRKNKKRGTI